VDTAVRTRTLRRAAEIVGGRAELRKCLNVSAICLAAWMTGLDTAPTDVFLKAVDIIMENAPDKADGRF
jgi:hypothetical protein